MEFTKYTSKEVMGIAINSGVFGAEAPNLLKALKGLVSSIKDSSTFHEEEHGPDSPLRLAEEAISKAVDLGGN